MLMNNIYIFIDKLYSYSSYTHALNPPFTYVNLGTTLEPWKSDCFDSYFRLADRSMRHSRVRDLGNNGVHYLLFLNAIFIILTLSFLLSAPKSVYLYSTESNGVILHILQTTSYLALKHEDYEVWHRSASGCSSEA